VTYTLCGMRIYTLKRMNSGDADASAEHLSLAPSSSTFIPFERLPGLPVQLSACTFPRYLVPYKAHLPTFPCPTLCATA